MKIGMVCVAMLAAMSSSANSALINYTSFSSYNAAVGSHTVITFLEVPDGSTLTTQYLAQGVTFDGTDFTLDSSFFTNDGQGNAGNGRIDLSFTLPQTHIGAFFPGAMTIDIYNGSTLLGTSNNFGSSGTGHFGGIVSDVAFNRAVLRDWVDDLVFIDDLHFGGAEVPEPGSIAAMLSLAGCGVGAVVVRRRRTKKLAA